MHIMISSSPLRLNERYTSIARDRRCTFERCPKLRERRSHPLGNASKFQETAHILSMIQALYKVLVNEKRKAAINLCRAMIAPILRVPRQVLLIILDIALPVELWNGRLIDRATPS
ncbi:uncharacterized protein SCHCODRAFT_02031649 [Schizophyllum commune H4-8]|uniref:uncharacterized protein n=1 Tax=Schizophyllum commune (strain H4-8 / FGSC 9210) TaxID=578458 RepID=UPI00215EF550|nr:uncharacterized protein SCHCODRAFT_02031649 [Schizophyllum commune H4-8]KAI5900219.1 hypothetical protein SCHCODRAFT_02031649 [Schizophyllum commune H4-8]